MSTKIAVFSELEDRVPKAAMVSNVDLVVIRYGEQISVMYGRCLHRGALLADGYVRGDDLICGLHDWDYRIESGVSAYNNEEALQKFKAWVEDDHVYVLESEIEAWSRRNPQPYIRDSYQGEFQDPHPAEEEPYKEYIRELANHGLKKVGHHGPVASMGVLRKNLPNWNDLEILTAQLHKLPLLDDEHVCSEVVIGPKAKKPLKLDIPLFVSDMSFGALSEEAKISLSKGAELAGTGICSGEGGMLPEEQSNNHRYFYELASSRFGYKTELLKNVQAFHFKLGQAAKTGTGGHLLGNKVTDRIAEVRGLKEGQAAISPSRFPDWTNLDHFKNFSEEVRELTGGIPIGVKLSAQHIEHDIDAALHIGVDYIILDGRGGGTGTAPLIFRDNISVPTIAALARARKHLDNHGANQVTLIITGGLRTAADYLKALMLGADAIAIANSALQAIGCLGMRACHTNNCPVGIATQKDHLRRRLEIEAASYRLKNYLRAEVDLMKVISRACGYSNFSEFNIGDLSTWQRNIADLTGVAYAGNAATNIH